MASCLLNFSRYPQQSIGSGSSMPADEEDDEVLSVGSETPPPVVNPCSPEEDQIPNTDTDESCDTVDCASPPVPTIGALKFSIANILKPEFGSGRRKHESQDRTCSGAGAVPVPIDLSRDSVNPPPPPPSVASTVSSASSSSSLSSSAETSTASGAGAGAGAGAGSDPLLWPAWVYCTRYSDRPSSGPRTRRPKRKDKRTEEEKRPRTAFSNEQLARLKHEFTENRYLTEHRRTKLARELGLNEAQIKIWFQNKRAKMKKASGNKNPLALQLMAQGLYNHSTVPLTREEEEQAAAVQGNH